MFYVSLVLLFQYLSLFKQKNITKNSISKLHRGKVRFRARLKSLEEKQQRLSPISSKMCTFWKLTLLKRYTSNGNIKWTTISVIHSNNLLMKLFDETGEVYVLPTEVDLNLEKSTRDISFQELKELSAIYQDINLRSFNDSLIIRVVEEIVLENSDLICTGYFEKLRSNRMPQVLMMDKKFPSQTKYIVGETADVVSKKKGPPMDFREVWERQMHREERYIYAFKDEESNRLSNVVQDSKPSFGLLQGTVSVGFLGVDYKRSKPEQPSLVIKPIREIVAVRKREMLYFGVFATIVLGLLYLV